MDPRQATFSTLRLPADPAGSAAPPEGEASGAASTAGAGTAPQAESGGSGAPPAELQEGPRGELWLGPPGRERSGGDGEAGLHVPDIGDVLHSAGLREEEGAWLFSLLTVAAVIGTLAGARMLFRRQAAGKGDSGFRAELTMFLLTLFGVVAVLLTLPVIDSMRAQLVSIFGLLLSAAIALSSTTFLGNLMAGLMLRAVRSFRTGDFLHSGEHFGRVTERGLLHTELQTEDSDLTTLPNLHLVTKPYTVVRAGGTIVTATVSLGYDVSRTDVERLLLEAAGDAALDRPFVHVADLGDFSVVYRVGGLLSEVKQLLSTRSQLRGSMMDRLHAAGVEIASPTLMSTRAFPKEATFTPARTDAVGAAGRGAAGKVEGAVDGEPDGGAMEAIAFEKADQAATIDELTARIEATEAELEQARSRQKGVKDPAEQAALEAGVRRLEERSARQRALLDLRKKQLELREAEGS